MDIARERGSAQALIIEDAETEILQLSKRAVLGLWTASRYRLGVEDIIRRAQVSITPSMQERIRTPLLRYAEQVYIRQRDILRQHAVFLAVLASYKREGYKRSAKALEARTARFIGRDVVSSAAFQSELTRAKREEHFRRAASAPTPDPEAEYTELSMYKTGLPLDEYHATYMERVNRMYDDLVNDTARQAYNSRVSLRNVAELTVRYEYQADRLRSLRESGVRLVWIVPHANCSARCAPHQGRLYSLDGTSGVQDGIRFEPIERATDIHPVTIKSGPNAGRRVYNGCLTGFGCRHEVRPYKRGYKPETIPASVVERGREVNARQREYERKIRYAKRMAIERGGTPEGRAAGKQAREWQRQYVNYCRANDVAYYPDRLRLLDGDI